MTFEKEFPSLKYKTCQIAFSVEKHNGVRWSTEEYYSRGYVEEKDIQQHCLDKQKVKEIISRCNYIAGSHKDHCNTFQLLKEFGLEGKE